MNKKILAAGITTALLLGLAVSEADAFMGVGKNGQNSENREAIEAAIEDGDYAAFQELLPENMAENFTEEKFQEMIERRAEGEARRAEMEQHREEVEAAIAAGDYATWQALIEEQNPDNPMLEKINAGNFSKLQELHELREKARSIQEELGLEIGGGRGGPGGEMHDGGFGGRGGFGGKGMGQAQANE